MDVFQNFFAKSFQLSKETRDWLQEITHVNRKILVLINLVAMVSICLYRRKAIICKRATNNWLGYAVWF